MHTTILLKHQQCLLPIEEAGLQGQAKVSQGGDSAHVHSHASPIQLTSEHPEHPSSLCRRRQSRRVGRRQQRWRASGLACSCGRAPRRTPGCWRGWPAGWRASSCAPSRAPTSWRTGEILVFKTLHLPESFGRAFHSANDLAYMYGYRIQKP